MSDITISLNNVSTSLKAPCSLSALLQSQTPFASGEKNFAAAVNGEFVPRSRYHEVVIQHGDEVDIVTPVGGG